MLQIERALEHGDRLRMKPRLSVDAADRVEQLRLRLRIALKLGPDAGSGTIQQLSRGDGLAASDGRLREREEIGGKQRDAPGAFGFETRAIALRGHGTRLECCHDREARRQHEQRGRHADPHAMTANEPANAIREAVLLCRYRTAVEQPADVVGKLRRGGIPALGFRSQGLQHDAIDIPVERPDQLRGGRASR